MRPTLGDKLSITDMSLNEASHWTGELERRASQRTGQPIAQARAAIARRVGAMPGTLENLRKGRLNDIGRGLYERIRLALIDELSSEVRRLEHEIQTLRQIGVGCGSREMAEAIAHLEKARAALGNP
ncbi:hypothetical protein GCM10007276_12090 [Agaricicola taiwanensis]|uniref:Uncharacterized protein n=2 Tax=Agaricicola taiwanensis TaxID=591372 RepID=A0A8J2VRE4_9RHOB|nr:hypothetical protein GCM10007276_12090 [Agaricicola taiwanensis]